MATALFREAGIPRRLMPAAIARRQPSTFTMSAMPGTPAIPNAIPMPFFGTTPFAAPGLGIIASAIMLGFGLWWLQRAGSACARRAAKASAMAAAPPVDAAADDPLVRERAVASRANSTRPRSIAASPPPSEPPILLAALPLVVVVRGEPADVPGRAAATSTPASWPSRAGAAPRLAAVAGVWSVAVALVAAIVVLLAVSGRRIPSLRATMDAGANASVLPIFSVASLVGFGAVVAAMPAFEVVRDWVLGIGGGPLVSLAVGDERSWRR